MSNEDLYDTVVAPMLLDVARKCEELGFSLVARVEWSADEAGITQMNGMQTVGQMLTLYAAHSGGNIDKLCMSLMKRADVSQSFILAPWAKRAGCA